MNRHVFDFDAPPDLPAADLIRLLGGKGGNLAVMANQLRLPVPPGFTISTEACREYLAGAWPAGLDAEVREHMARLGALAGREFGDAGDPLLVSVRSGAPVSMPGMMDTILDLGLTPDTLPGFARSTGSTEFAADCRRRLAVGWRSVIGSDDVPDDPWVQLRTAIEAVFRSWNSDRARAYRTHEGIPDDLGTAVTVQAMVFGNRGPNSGTGVLFTRNPSTGEHALYGDFMFNAQGEDVVAGDHATQTLGDLEARLPRVAVELRRHARVLERHYADLCDIEFTVEEGRLWMLQVRVGKRSPRAAMRMAIEMAEDPTFPLERDAAVKRVASHLADPPRLFEPSGAVVQPITIGLPASPGIASGEIVLTARGAEEAARAGTSVILVRAETSPEDVAGMAKSAGILTASGGLASHAAVVARGWGIPAVVGAAEVRPAGDHVMVAGRRLAAGDVITIDGSNGNVYVGELAGTWQVAPEAATLLGWARELGLSVDGAAESTLTPAPAAERATAAVTRDDLLRLLLIKGMAPVGVLAEALMSPAEQVQPLVDGLVADGLATVSDDGDARLSPAGKASAEALFAADARRYADAAAVELLEQFHALDTRMKQIVTSWQLRDAGGTQTFNDHSDADYDRGVLDALAALHSDATAWLAPLSAELPHIQPYERRLQRALDAARGGDPKYVASPRVDSYHSAWFELHEDLIRSTGRNRADEVAAGRA